MGDRYHIIITGEDGRSSTFQFSRHKFFLGAALCTVVFVGACILGLTASSLISSSRQLDRKVEKLKTELARKEKAAAIYQAQVAKLERAKEEQLENLRNEYEYKLHTQKAQYDVENTNLQLENVNLINSAISDLNAKSELIESVMDNIGVRIIKAAEESQENSGGPFIPAGEPSFDELAKKVDDYLRIIKYMPLGKPIKGPISSKFGTRNDPLNKKKSIHEGVDIRGSRGEEIRSTADGVVIKAFKNGGYGNYLEIDHGNGYRTVYAHLKKFLVKKGQSIKRGQTIGLVGSTGRSTGPHLHYEILLHKKPVNPDKFMQVADLAHTLPAPGPGNVQK